MGITVIVVFGVVIYVLFRKDLNKEKVFDVSTFLPKWRININ
jgi:hypothetical protein